jgi:hypothetical protein
MCLINARSICNKTTVIKAYIVEDDSDMAALTETWLKEDDNVTLGDIRPKGYKFIHEDRKTGQRGGGVGLLYKKLMKIKEQKISHFNSFEYSESLIMCKINCVRNIIVYRPPPSEENCLTTALFFEEFQRFLEYLITKPEDLLITGDFNFHMDDKNNYYASRFKCLLDSFSLTQHVTEPTHKDGHTLDLVITRSSDEIISDLYVDVPTISDHSVIHFKINMRKPQPEEKVISYRKLDSIDSEKFKEDLRNSTFVKCPNQSLEGLFEQYNVDLASNLNKHAPIRKCKVIVRPNAPWYTDELRGEKRKRRKLERKMRKNKKSLSHKEKYIDQCKKYNELLIETRRVYYNDIFKEKEADQKKVFETANKLLHKKNELILPSHTSLEELSNRFADFFEEKIMKIRDNLDYSRRNEKFCGDSNNCASKMTNFTPCTEKQIHDIIKKTTSKQCPLDPLPTQLVKENIDILLPTITRIVNLSLQSGVMPSNMKEALLTPLLKKSDLDPEVMKNYRPISNLSYISKIIEKAVAEQLNTYCAQNNLQESFQSAYKPLHSTETALVRVNNDILTAVDEKNGVILLLLDLSAAFDTVDHSILLQRLKNKLGITGVALEWFKSYLHDRTQKVHINGTYSTSHTLSYGVPQGSVLGPILFSIYTMPLGELIRKHNLSFHFYADDTQLYIYFKRIEPCFPDSMSAAKAILEKCIQEIRVWMALNFLQLNDDKTECLLISSKYREKIPLNAIRIGNEDITPSCKARNIGVIFDHEMNMDYQISSIIRQCYYQIRRVGKIRKILTINSAKTIVHALITAKLDYCNSLLIGLPENQISRLQRLQNSAARLIYQTRKYDHVTPLLYELHWLPVRYRISYKVILLTYKGLNNLAPQYISDLLKLKETCHNLRSEDQQMLVETNIETVTYGGRAFSIIGPKLWNSCPVSIRKCETVIQFKNNLKTYLFGKAYGI